MPLETIRLNALWLVLVIARYLATHTNESAFTSNAVNSPGGYLRFLLYSRNANPLSGTVSLGSRGDRKFPAASNGIIEIS